MTIALEVELDKPGFENFNELVSEVFRTAMEIGRKLVTEALEYRDEELRENRDKKRYRCKGKRKTCIKTNLGAVEYSRNVYIDKAGPEQGGVVYLLDEDLGIQKIGLVNEDVCRIVAETVCESTYREVSRVIDNTIGFSISAQGVWNLVQRMGKTRKKQVRKQADQAAGHKGTGVIETPILYEENDGIWLSLQGKSRKEYGRGREMKVGIAYDGVTSQKGKGGKQRRTLNNKTAYAGFETAQEFQRNKEGVIASRINVDEVELRVINGDGAQWIQKHGDSECISVLDAFHRNKKITECVRDKEFANLLRDLLKEKRFDDLMECLEAQINSVTEVEERAGLLELQMYYRNNREALPGYRDRGIRIPETREPGVLHHARLGSMESNVFTLIGNRMKGRRASWSIQGANHLALLLCAKHTTGLENLFSDVSEKREESLCSSGTSAAKTQKKVGEGTTAYHSASLDDNPWMRKITSFVPPSELKFI